MISSIQIDTYRDCILSIKCGLYKGSVIKAKPLLVLSVIFGVEKNLLQNNHLYFSSDLGEIYEELHKAYNLKVTPLFKPFYYLQFDKFWHLKWRTMPYAEQHPSSSFIRQNIEYAYLDNALWDMLQEEPTREYLKNEIINYYLN